MKDAIALSMIILLARAFARAGKKAYQLAQALACAYKMFGTGCTICKLIN